MRQKHLRQNHRSQAGIYLHRHGGHVPRRNALCARTRRHRFGHRGRREGDRPARRHLDRLPLQPRTGRERHLRQWRPGGGTHPHDRSEQLREPRQLDPPGTRKTRGYAAGDGSPAGNWSRRGSAGRRCTSAPPPATCSGSIRSWPL